MALVTMSEIVLEQVLKEAESVPRVLSEAEKVRKGRNKTYCLVQEEMGRAGSALSVQLQRDVDAGRLQARELVVQLSQVYARSQCADGLRWNCFRSTLSTDRCFVGSRAGEWLR